MKVEKAYTIDGDVVIQVFQKDNITVYEHIDNAGNTISYFTDNKTEKVLFKQTMVDANYEDIRYLGVN